MTNTWSRLLGHAGRSAALVLATWNPAGFGFLNLVHDNPQMPASLVFVVTFALIAGYVVTIRHAVGNMGRVGTVYLFLFCLCCLWLLADLGLIARTSDASDALAWRLLASLIVTMAVGLSWLDLRRAKSSSGSGARRRKRRPLQKIFAKKSART